MSSTYDHWVAKDADWGYGQPAKRRKKDEQVVWYTFGRHTIKMDANFSKPYTMAQPLKSRAFRILRNRGDITVSNGFFDKVFEKVRRKKMELDEPRRPKNGKAF